MQIVERGSSVDITVDQAQDRGAILQFPDQPGGDLQVVNVGDGKPVKMAGFAIGGSTLTLPVNSQLRQANLNVIPAGMSYGPDDLKWHLALRRYLHTIQPDGSNVALDSPEAGWVDPRS